MTLVLPNCEFVEGLSHRDGAKFDLLPGAPVKVEINDAGIVATGANARLRLTWSIVSYLDVRGPVTAEVPFEEQEVASLRTLIIAAAEMVSGAERHRGEPTKWCWLAVGRSDGPELIFRVRGYLRNELERLLEEHSNGPGT